MCPTTMIALSPQTAKHLRTVLFSLPARRYESGRLVHEEVLSTGDMDLIFGPVKVGLAGQSCQMAALRGIALGRLWTVAEHTWTPFDGQSKDHRWLYLSVPDRVPAWHSMHAPATADYLTKATPHNCPACSKRWSGWDGGCGARASGRCGQAWLCRHEQPLGNVSAGLQLAFKYAAAVGLQHSCGQLTCARCKACRSRPFHPYTATGAHGRDDLQGPPLVRPHAQPAGALHMLCRAVLCWAVLSGIKCRCPFLLYDA